MSVNISLQTSITNANLVTDYVSKVFQVKNTARFSVQAIATVNTPSAKVFASGTDIDNATDTFTSVAHGYTTGVKGQFTTSSALPAGLSLGVDYFAIVTGANTLKFATSLANALAGTPVVDITTNGTGNQTFTPTAIAATVMVQRSNVPGVLASSYVYNANDFTDIATPVAVSASGTTWIEETDPTYLGFVLKYAITAGRLSAVNHIVGKDA